LTDETTPFILGWEEWAVLPDLGLPAVKAKVDTGARTSALHASNIALSGPAKAPVVTFVVHPVPGQSAIEVACSAPLVDRREVISSNGERELRFVIRTPVKIGARTWPIEMTLTNRETMAYRMLLGRQAIQEGMLIAPTASFRQGKLSYGIYGAAVESPAEPRALRVAFITRTPDGPTGRLVSRALAARGHTVVVVDPSVVRFDTTGEATHLTAQGAVIDGIDAVLAGPSPRMRAFKTAIWRHFELQGAFTHTGAEDIAALADPFAPIQRLRGAGLTLAAPTLELTAESLASAPDHMAVLMVGGQVHAIRRMTADGLSAADERADAAVDRVVSDAARRTIEALRLGLAEVVVRLVAAGPAIAAVSAYPALARYGRQGRTALDHLIRLLETGAARVRG
jgi:ribosomal protein S6--L-glutamate ligase